MYRAYNNISTVFYMKPSNQCCQSWGSPLDHFFGRRVDFWPFYANSVFGCILRSGFIFKYVTHWQQCIVPSIPHAFILTHSSSPISIFPSPYRHSSHLLPFDLHFVRLDLRYVPGEPEPTLKRPQAKSPCNMLFMYADDTNLAVPELTDVTLSDI